MKNVLNIEHILVPIDESFEDFTNNLEGLLGLLKPADMDFMYGDNGSLAGLLESLGGDEELILFNIIEHGELLRLKGFTGKKAKQYQIGNPVMAMKMTARNISAGLYAPLRILVQQKTNGHVLVEYDLPSSVFAQFKDPEIDAVSALMDKKLEKLIAGANQSTRHTGVA